MPIETDASADKANHLYHYWEVGSNLPKFCQDFTAEDFSLSSFGPRTTAWISTSATGTKVSLIEGFNVANHGPPTIVMGTKLIAKEMRDALTSSSPPLCALSVGTTHQSYAAFSQMARRDGKTPIADITDISGLELETNVSKNMDGYPSPIASSPMQIMCRVQRVVPLDEESSMLFLEMDHVFLDASIMTKPPPSDRQVLAIIDGPLTRAVVSFGLGHFGTTDEWFRMARPKKVLDDEVLADNEVSAKVENSDGVISTWRSPTFQSFSGNLGLAKVEDPLLYTFKDDPGLLGYNPSKSIVQPRPIGWVSTFRKDGDSPSGTVSHLAPYSFFTILDAEHVAFVGYRNQEGKIKKDAQTDSELSGCFVWNIATQALAVPVNLSAAELGRDESEFELTGLEWSKATMVDAPMVNASPIRYECKYVSSTESGNYSVVVGKIQSIHLHSDVVNSGKQLKETSLLDISTLRPITRCGYTDEYALISAEWTGKE